MHSFKGNARLIAIKQSWRLAPDWTDVVYGSDWRWWVEQQGLPEFKGLKLAGSPYASRLFGNVRAVHPLKGETILLDEIGTVGCGSRTGGGHSGFHALNLAVQFGANPITLLGFDMSNGHPDTGIHRGALVLAIEQMAALGVRVVHGCLSQG